MAVRSKGVYVAGRKPDSRRCPRCDFAGKQAIGEFLDYLEAAAAATADRMARARQHKTSRYVRRTVAYWKHVRSAMRWANRVNEQRRSSDE